MVIGIGERVAAAVSGKPPAGRPSVRRKPIRSHLFRASVTYTEVAALARRSVRTVRAYVDGALYSIPVSDAIERLAPGAPRHPKAPKERGT
jgi:hypothetical protein